MRFSQAVVSAVTATKRLVTAFVIIDLLATLLVWRAGHSYHMTAAEEMDSRAKQCSSLRSMVDRSDELKALNGSYGERVMAMEAGLLAADRPATGAARLQEAFAALASKKGVAIVSQRALAAIPADYYIRVPVEFRVTTGLAELKELLYELRGSSVLMGASYIRIKAAEHGAPARLDVTLVVEGAIRRTEI